MFNPKDETQVHVIGGHEIKFSNLSKVHWPEEGYTKRDMLNYYYQIAEYIVPYILDRPQSLNRFPNGIDGESFYHKDMTASTPDWIQFFPYHTVTEKIKTIWFAKGSRRLFCMRTLSEVREGRKH